jgi:hypothetical protein
LSDTELVEILLAIAGLSLLVVAVVVVRVDRRSPRTAPTGRPVRPLPRRARAGVARIISPIVVIAFFVGTFGFHHVWAGVVLAALVAAYMTLVLGWLWRHVQVRHGAR